MTVKDVAGYLQLSEMMVYKLAQGGRLPAVKIGRVWRFEKEAVDQWLKSKQQIGCVSDVVSNVIQDFSTRLKEAFGDNLSRIVIFGSYARGEWTEGSDLDVLVVLKIIKDRSRIEEQIGEISYDVTYDMDRMILMTPIIIDEREYLTGMSPLILNIRKEGKIAA